MYGKLSPAVLKASGFSGGGEALTVAVNCTNRALCVPAWQVVRTVWGSSLVRIVMRQQEFVQGLIPVAGAMPFSLVFRAVRRIKLRWIGQLLFVV